MILHILSLLVFLCVSQAAQVPFELLPNEVGDWNLSSSPEPDYTGHLIFNTVSSLLRQLPNVRYRNGICGLGY